MLIIPEEGPGEPCIVVVQLEGDRSRVLFVIGSDPVVHHNVVVFVAIVIGHELFPVNSSPGHGPPDHRPQRNRLHIFLTSRAAQHDRGSARCVGKLPRRVSAVADLLCVKEQLLRGGVLPVSALAAGCMAAVQQKTRKCGYQHAAKEHAGDAAAPQFCFPLSAPGSNTDLHLSSPAFSVFGVLPRKPPAQLRKPSALSQALDHGKVAVEDGVVPQGGDLQFHGAADLGHAVAVHLGQDLFQE